VRLFFFVLVIKFTGSAGEADAAHQVLKAPNPSGEDIEARPQEKLPD